MGIENKTFIHSPDNRSGGDIVEELDLTDPDSWSLENGDAILVQLGIEPNKDNIQSYVDFLETASNAKVGKFLPTLFRKEIA